MFVSINTEDIREAVQENPSLKKNGEQWAGSGKFSENGVREAYTCEPEHPRARKYPWNRETLHRYQLAPIDVMVKVCSNDRF